MKNKLIRNVCQIQINGQFITRAASCQNIFKNNEHSCSVIDVPLIRGKLSGREPRLVFKPTLQFHLGERITYESSGDQSI